MNHEVGTKLKQMFEIADELFEGSETMVKHLHVYIEKGSAIEQLKKQEADAIGADLLAAGFVSKEKEYRSHSVDHLYKIPTDEKVPGGKRKYYSVTVSSEISDAELIEKLELEREAAQKRIDDMKKKQAKDPDSERSAV